MTRTRQFVPAMLAAAAVMMSGDQAHAQVSGETSNIFINEFHYDNTGADVGEAIEIALPTGTDISNLSVVLTTVAVVWLTTPCWQLLAH